MSAEEGKIPGWQDRTGSLLPLEDPLASDEKGGYTAYPHQALEIALQEYSHAT